MECMSDFFGNPGNGPQSNVIDTKGTDRQSKGRTCFKVGKVTQLTQMAT